MWVTVAYGSIFVGFCALARTAFLLHRICVRLSTHHSQVFEGLGSPDIRKTWGWPSTALGEFLRARDYERLNDTTLSLLCVRTRRSLRLAALFAAIAFVSVFAEAFTRPS